MWHMMHGAGWVGKKLLGSVSGFVSINCIVFRGMYSRHWNTVCIPLVIHVDMLAQSFNPHGLSHLMDGLGALKKSFAYLREIVSTSGTFKLLRTINCIVESTQRGFCCMFVAYSSICIVGGNCGSGMSIFCSRSTLSCITSFSLSSKT